jgi:hypothetical protein
LLLMQLLALLEVPVYIVLEFIESLPSVRVVLIVIVILQVILPVHVAPALLVMCVVDVTLGVKIHIVDVEVVV